jgi:hypothetical protein
MPPHLFERTQALLAPVILTCTLEDPLPRKVP